MSCSDNQRHIAVNPAASSATKVRLHRNGQGLPPASAMKAVQRAPRSVVAAAPKMLLPNGFVSCGAAPPQAPSREGARVQGTVGDEQYCVDISTLSPVTRPCRMSHTSYSTVSSGSVWSRRRSERAHTESQKPTIPSAGRCPGGSAAINPVLRAADRTPARNADTPLRRFGSVRGARRA